MRTIYKNSLYIALSALLCLFLANPANAQRGATSSNNNNGGGGTRPSGGGGSSPAPAPSSSRPSGGGGGVSYRPSSGGNVGISRPSYGGGGVAPQRSSGQPGYGNYRPSAGTYGYSPRQGVAPARGNYGYAPRQGNTVRGNYGYAPRQGVTANSYPSGVAVTSRGATSGGGGYRTYPPIGYGHGGYWGNHGYNYHYRGYYNSYYLPRLGFSIGYLPYGYYPFYYGDYQYFYSDGLFYQYDNSEYTVVEPPIGAEITTLPEKAQSIVINGQQYYELNGVYYQPVTKDDGTLVYQIAGKDGELNTTNSTLQDNQPQGPQMGDIVTQLPPDCRRIKVNGEKLYVSPDGVYYQEQGDSNNRTYKVVGLPSDEPEQN